MNLRTTAFALALLLAGGIAGYAVAATDLPLDPDGQKIYDQTAGDSRSLVGLQGPGGIRLYASKLDALDRPVKQYLRFNAGLDPKLIEIAILATALTGLGEAEATLIELGREAVGRHAVSSATFATAERIFGREKLIHYVALLGDYAATGILLTTFDQQLPAGQVSKLPVP